MKKRHTGMQIVAELRQADVLIGQGKTVPQVCREIEADTRLAFPPAAAILFKKAL